MISKVFPAQITTETPLRLCCRLWPSAIWLTLGQEIEKTVIGNAIHTLQKTKIPQIMTLWTIQSIAAWKILQREKVLFADQRYSSGAVSRCLSGGW